MTQDPRGKDFEGGLRGALAGAAEGLPDNPNRYEQTEARVRRNRRRTGMAVVAAAVLVVAGLALPQVIGPRGGGAGETMVTKARDLDSLNCPAPAGPGTPKATGSGPLVPEGAVSARFCPGKASIDGAPQADPNLTGTTITQGVDQLVTALNTLEPASGNPICTDDLGATYELLLAYPDRRQVQVSFEAYGCGVARSGSEYRTGARGLVDLGQKLVSEQPGQDPRLECPADRRKVGAPADQGPQPFVPAGAIAAELCAGEALSNGGLPEQVKLGKVDTSEVVAKLNALPRVDPNAVCTMELGVTYDLMLAYPDGSETRVTFEGYGCGFAQAGNSFRMGANQIADITRGFAEQKRIGSTPARPVTTPECREPAKLVPGEDGRQSQLYGALTKDPDRSVLQPAVAGRACRYSSSDGRSAQLTGQRELTASQAGELATAFNQAAKQRSLTCDWTAYDGPVDIVLFTDKAGGQYELRVLRGDCPAVLDINGVAEAGPALLDRIDAVLGPR